VRTQPGDEIGIDDTKMPFQLAYPYKDKSWQSPKVAQLTKDAEDWSIAFGKDIEEL